MSFISTALSRISMSGVQNSNTSEASPDSDFVHVPPPPAPRAPVAPGGPSVTLSLSQKLSSIGKTSDRTKNQYVATLTASAMPEEKSRAPIDVVVAVDTSGSMSTASKLSLCKSTISLLLKELKAGDRFALVNFGDEARVVCEMGGVGRERKAAAESAINRLCTQGCTNLSGGLTLGLQQLQSVSDPAAVRSLMLLTDGHANRGVSEPDGIVELLKGVLGGENSDNISVNTFGYGADHQADLLRRISEASDTPGSYYFVEEKDDVSSAFGDCLGGLLSVVAQNIRLTIEGCDGTTVEVAHDKGVRQSATKWTVDLGDIFAEEVKDIVIPVLGLDATSLGDSAEVTVSLSYVDVLNSRPHTEPPQAIATSLPPGSEVSDRNPYVVLQHLRVSVVAALKSSTAAAQAKDVSRARAVIDEALLFLTEATSGLELSPADRQVVDTYRQDLQDVLPTLRTYSEYERYGSKLMSLKGQSHSMQRCNASAETEYNPYRGHAKMAMARKMKGK